MDELGLILLQTDSETEANFFSSNILAPRPVIHLSKCTSEVEISKLFGLTIEAAKIAFSNYISWRKYKSQYGFNDYDQTIYKHFWDSSHNIFVYSRKSCMYCSNIIVNSNSSLCPICNAKSMSLSDFDRFNDYSVSPDFFVI